jgi:hypothetical protein
MVPHGWPWPAQLAACAGVGAVIDMITGKAIAAGAYFNTNSRRDMPGFFPGWSTRPCRRSCLIANHTKSSSTGAPNSNCNKRAAWLTVVFPSQYFQTKAELRLRQYA